MARQVLHVSTTLNTGGAQRVTSTLLRHLSRQVVSSRLCLVRNDIGFDVPGDVSVHCLDHRRPWDWPRTVFRLRRLIEDTAPDVVLSNVSATSLLTGLALLSCRRQPVWIVRIAGSPAHHDGLIRTLIANRVYPRADRFVVNSRGLGEGLARRHPFTAGKIDCLANPTDFSMIDRLAAEPPPHRKEGAGPLVIAVGRLFPQKRYDLLIRAFAAAGGDSGATLWICGDGPLRQPLTSLIADLRLQERVRLLGFCENPFALLRQADVFVMTSDWEGLPNALIEAQGLGIPAVSTRCPYGPEEIIEAERTGILVPPGDVGAIAAAMRRLLGDATLRAQMAREARAHARAHFGVELLAGAWENLLANQQASR